MMASTIMLPATLGVNKEASLIFGYRLVLSGRDGPAARSLAFEISADEVPISSL